MPVNNTAVIIKGLERLDWEPIAHESNGVVAAILIGGEPVKVEKVDGKNSYEEADDLFVILKVGTQLFRKTGYYQSHYGSTWDSEVTEVVTSTKTVTVYTAR